MNIHAYATTDIVKQYLAGTNHASAWQADEPIMYRQILAASKRIDQFVGRSFGPRLEDHVFDLGRGTLRSDASRSSGVALKLGSPPIGIVPFDDWLVTPNTVTAYNGSDQSSSETLVEGLANDYILEPYNRTPKVKLKLSENSTKTLGAGQQTLSVLGYWGYSYDVLPLTTLSADINSTVTSFDLSSSTAGEAGQTLKIEDEMLHVISVSGATITVIRGVNGTTAAAHVAVSAPVYIVNYPYDVVDACVSIVKARMNERQAGLGQNIALPEMGMTVSRPGSEEMSILNRLKHGYRRDLPQAGVYF